MSYNPPPKFGPFIKHFLKLKHARKSSLEKTTGITRKTLARWEKGDGEWIQYGTLEKFAEYFGLTLDDFFKEFDAYQQNITSDAPQTASISQDAQEIVTTQAVPIVPTNPTVPSSNKWKPVVKVVGSLLIFACLVFTSYALIINPLIQSNKAKPAITKQIIIKGKVLCANNEPVVAIWSDVFQGSTVNKDISGYADLRTPNSSGSEVGFVYVLRGDAYNLHVGCGGSIQHWKGVYKTELGSGPVHDHKSHFFTCYDISKADYGSCELKY